MIDTIYSLFETAVANHKDKTAIIENNRNMTFGELSDLVDIIVGGFPEKVSSIGQSLYQRIGFSDMCGYIQLKG